MKRFVLCVFAAGLLAVPAAAAASSLVSVGSPADRTPQNHQNEPAVAVDAQTVNGVITPLAADDDQGADQDDEAGGRDPCELASGGVRAHQWNI